MFDGKKEDWKDFLNEDAKEVLAEILENIKKHRCAYSCADDVKVAQLWTAIIEIKKELEETNKMLRKVEAPFRAIIEVGEKEKVKTIEKMISEIIKPTDEETQEATKKLVESLMKF